MHRLREPILLPSAPPATALLLLTEWNGGRLTRSPRGAAVSRPSDLVQGTLDLLILKILALEAQNGWGIGQRLRQVSGEILQVSDGSLYPALHKLEHRGWI